MSEMLTAPGRDRPTAEQVVYFRGVLWMPACFPNAEILHGWARAELARLQREDPDGYVAATLADTPVRPGCRRAPTRRWRETTQGRS
jgi:hypothetical protein